MLGTGVALQHQQAATMADDESVRPGLLLALIRRPLWLVGMACDIVGFGLQAVAVVGGRAICLLSAAPTSSSHAEAGMRGWVTCSVIVWGGVAVVAAWATSKPARVRGAALAVCAGLSAGFLAVASKAFGARLGDGVLSTLGSWQPYVLIASGIITTLMLQSAYQANAPTLTFPLIEITAPLTAATIGITLFDESISLAGWRSVIVVLALVLMIGGIVNLGRDPLIVAGPSYDTPSK